MFRVAAAVLIVSALIALPVVAQEPSPARFFASRLPSWFPLPAIPQDNPISAAKVELGRFLFYDKRLSGNGTYSCGSCHQQALAFTDGLAHAVGSTGQHHSRSSMSLANVAYNASFGWGDRRDTLESQMEVPMYNDQPIEMGLKGRETEVLRRFSIGKRDLERFQGAFPGDDAPINFPNIVKAIASFERVLMSGDSPYDRYRFLGDQKALSPAAQRGLSLFFSDRLRCSECHANVNLSGPTIFDGSVPPDPGALFHDTGVSPQPAQFRAPTLRNIAVTAPYMHDGRFATLEAVIDHYSSGGKNHPNKDVRIQPMHFTDSEKAALVAFLKTLTDPTFLADPRFSDPFE